MINEHKIENVLFAIDKALDKLLDGKATQKDYNILKGDK